MGKHRSHSDWPAQALKTAALLLAALLLRYEWTIMSQCAAEDSYEHAHNLLRLSHAACNEDYYIFAGQLDCALFRRAVDPAIRAASKAACWWERHVLFSSWIGQTLFALALLYIIRLTYNYLMTVRRYEYQEARRVRDYKYTPHHSVIIEKVE
jgi:hypothetical protein